MQVNEVVVNVFFSLFWGAGVVKGANTTLCRHAGAQGYGGSFLQSWENFVVVDQTVNVNSPSLM